MVRLLRPLGTEIRITIIYVLDNLSYERIQNNNFSLPISKQGSDTGCSRCASGSDIRTSACLTRRWFGQLLSPTNIGNHAEWLPMLQYEVI
jgi:hypothetical protein